MIGEERSENLDKEIRASRKTIDIHTNLLQTKKVKYKGRKGEETGEITWRKKETSKKQNRSK